MAVTDTDPWADIVEPAPLAPYWADDTVTLYAGDCLDVLRELEDCTIDAVATDPPYNLSFMGKSWDAMAGRQDAGFLSWLAGLIDGEGHFAIKEHTRGTHAPAFTLKMRADERGTLEAIRRTLGFGSLTFEERPGTNPMVKWTVQSKADCHALVDILDQYPLRAKKRIDYWTWREAVCEWTDRPRGNRWAGPTDNTRMASLRGRLMETRAYREIPWSGHEFQDWVRLWSEECFRVLKPGGHIVAFGGSRTWHRLTAGIEDAGFTIRDSIAWLYASGFPKSMDVTDAVERWQAGQALDAPTLAIRDGVYEVTRFLKAARDKAGWTNRQIDELFGTNGMSGHWVSQGSQPAVPSVRQWSVLKERLGFGDAMDGLVAELASTERPEDWGSGDGQDGPFLASLGRNPDASGVGPWGTAMKPAFEPIVVGRKPPAGTLPANIQTWGTGALNIDGCRTVMSSEDRENFLKGQAAWKEHGERHGDGEHKATEVYDKYGLDSSPPNAAGRWPANVVLDPVMAAELDRVGPQSTSPAGPVTYSQPTRPSTTETVEASGERREVVAGGYGDSGGASRFFPIFRYEAKASTRERPKIDKPGTEPDELIGGVTRTNRQCRVCGSQTIKQGEGNEPSCGHDDWEWVPSAAVDKPQQVAHPTVKPLDLMRWLVRLVTPPGGTVLEPFAGSGTTAEACVLEGMKCVAIEREADYLPLIVQRLTKPLQPALFLEGL